MCMDVPANDKMGDRSSDDEIQILEEHIKESTEANVKQERPDEAEIRELAAKMVEANKAKTAAAAAAAANTPSAQRLNTQSNLYGLLGYLNSNKKTTVTLDTSQKNAKTADGKTPLDDESQRGRFGWTSFGSDIHIPYLFRGTDQYCAVRILEYKLLNKYLNYLHSDIYSCTCIRSYYITEAESRLLNEINNRHCESQFGREQFTCKDLIVKLTDAKEFYTFLDVCYAKLTSGASQNVLPGHKSDKCGFIRINKESVVPYTVKDGLKYVPLFYFEGETDNLKLKAEKLDGWDLSYLKFCCKVQGIRNELFASETCSVISLNDIKSYFAPGTNFEDYWPSKVMDSQLLVTSNKGNSSNGGWTKQPVTPPRVITTLSLHNNNLSNAINSRNSNNSAALRNMVARNHQIVTSVGGDPLRRINQSRPMVSTHSAHSTPSIVSSIRNIPVSQTMLNAVQATAANGWSGLVGGQPTFQALVSQPNNIIQMTANMHNQFSLSKAYQQQQQQQQQRSRGGTPNSYANYANSNIQGTSHVQPPPLIRSTSQNISNIGTTTTYTSASLGLSNPATGSPYPQMIGLRTDQVQSLMPPPSSTPSLIPHSPSPTMLNSTHSNHSKNYPPPPLIPVNGNNNNARDSRGRKPLTPINDAPSNITQSAVMPYQVQKALVEDKMIPCINWKPYIYSDLLMTLSDFVTHFFPNCDVESCRQVLSDVLQVELFQGNRLQMEQLMKTGKCSSLNEELPLIPVRIVMKYMPQLKYMFNNKNVTMPTAGHSSEEHPAKKRQRTS